MSNHFQMSEQRKHNLFSNLKPLTKGQMRIQPGPDTLNIGKNPAESQMGTSQRYMYLPAKKIK